MVEGLGDKVTWPLMDRQERSIDATARRAGRYRYYGMSGNIRSLQNFYHQVVRLAFKWINRRSQKKSYNWAQFHRFILFNPLPKPKIYHSLYNLIP